MRYPTNDVAPLDATERNEVFWKKGMKVLQYHHLPHEDPPNASLYLCRETGYSLESLSSNNRSKVRRGLKRLAVRQVKPQDVASTGYACYADTRQRHGMPHLTREQFLAHWHRERDDPNREIWAALEGDEILAFGLVHLCGKWASISSTVSSNAGLRDYSNHALFYVMLEHLMNEAGVESASYGLSSLRPETSQSSLHHFKSSIGLQSIPVVRRIEVHPVLRPLVTPAVGRVLRSADRRLPNARLLRSARAAMDFLTGDAPVDSEQHLDRGTDEA